MITIDFSETLATLRPLQQQFVLRQIGEQALLYPVVSNVAALSRYVTLNELGLKLWKELIVAAAEPKDVLSEILESYDCTQEELYSDCAAFLNELHDFMQDASQHEA
jgi:hypothetical protein